MHSGSAVAIIHRHLSVPAKCTHMYSYAGILGTLSASLSLYRKKYQKCQKDMTAVAYIMLESATQKQLLYTVGCGKLPKTLHRKPHL